MKALIGRVYSIYAGILFVLTFLFFYPVFLFAILFPRFEKYGLIANYWWANIYFPLVFIPVKREWRFKRDKKQNYVLCANHFSFLDIPTMAFFPGSFKFIGKKSLTKIPVFGYMFKKLHIIVDRKEVNSRSKSLKKGLSTLDKGQSLMIFPEGGILTKSPPNMVKYKDGAFKAAIIKNVPIVPITIPYNFKIMPDDGKFSFYWHHMKIIFHEPIPTQELTLEDVEWLKDKTFKVINDELKTHLPESF